MMNFKSVTNSEPQVRSNPALRPVNEQSGFQKRLSALLEPTPLPFPTFQIAKENSQYPLSQHPHYAWVRPARLRPQWLVLTDDLPLMIVDSRDSRRTYSIRIPFDKRRVQHTGPIVCEAAWDPQDHILWIWDVVVWERAVVWNTMPYSRRWELVKEVVAHILDCGHPMSDAEVSVPTWQSLTSMKEFRDLDPAMSVDFQPEKAGQRRHVFLIKHDGPAFRPQSHAERQMVALANSKIVKKPVHTPPTLPIASKAVVSAPTLMIPPIVLNENTVISKPVSTPLAPAPIPTPASTEKQTVGRIHKDTYSKLPDSYRIRSIVDNSDLGLAAIRSLAMSKQLRISLQSTESVLCDIQWFEPFQKYEVKKVHT
jgi:hypothetical protein